MTNAILRGKPDAGNPHVRFDEGEVASAKPRRGSLLYKYLCLILSICGVGCACDRVQHVQESQDKDIGMNDCFRIYPGQLASFIRNGTVGDDGNVAERLGDFYSMYQGDFQRDLLWYWIGANRGNSTCVSNLSARIVNSELAAPALMKSIGRIVFSKMETDAGLPKLISKDVLECRGVGIYDMYEVSDNVYVEYCVRRVKVDETDGSSKSVRVLVCNGDLIAELGRMGENGAFREFGDEYFVLVKAVNYNKVEQGKLIQMAVKIFPEIANARIVGASWARCAEQNSAE